MGTTKVYNRLVVKGAGTIIGSATFAGSGQVTMAAPMTITGSVTVNARLSIQTPAFIKNSSASTQFAGRTALGSGTLSVTVSTSVVKSDSIIMLTPILNAAIANAQVSGSVVNALCVQTISDGSFFTIAWLGNPGTSYGAAVNVSWFIVLGT